MAANAYHFIEDWLIPASIDEVWQVLSRISRYPEWWKPVYLEAELIGSAGGPADEPHVGQLVRVVAKGRLPYKLRFNLRTVALQRPTLIECQAAGDFVGRSRWTLRPEDSGTIATLDWAPVVEKPLIKILSPALKSLFEWNHRWTMRHGEAGLRAYLQNSR
jgi:hypothetical protein